MDAEDEEASPPLQQHSDAPGDLPSTAPQCDTDLQNFPNAGGGDHEVVIAGELSEGDAGTSTDNKDKVVEEEGTVIAEMGEAIEETEIADLANEQVMDVEDDTADGGNEIVEVEDSVAWRTDDAEKGNASGPVDDAIYGVGMEDEIIEGNGNGNGSDTVAQGTDVETGKVEEDADDNTEEADTVVANEAALMEEEEEEEEEEEDEKEEEADADAAGGGNMAEDTEAAEEMEVAEEQSRSTSGSGGKRKRGTGKNSKSTGRVPSRKKMEEDVCFICFDGGDLVLCDRR